MVSLKCRSVIHQGCDSVIPILRFPQGQGAPQLVNTNDNTMQREGWISNLGCDIMLTSGMKAAVP
jgi:hypothetical protein